MTQSGKLQLTFTAFEPYALMDTLYYTSSEEAREDIREMQEVSGVISESMMPQCTAQIGTRQIIYNPGTERTNRVKIIVAGTTGADGLTITNYTTGEVCKLVELPAENRALVIDTYTGTVTYEDNGEYAFAYHNYGYLTFAGCGMFRRNVKVTHKGDPSIIKSNGAFYKDIDKGMYMYVGNEWKRILDVSSQSELTLDGWASVMGEESIVTIAAMNEIELSGAGTNLTRFEISFTP